MAMKHGAQMLSPMSQIHFHQMGGAIERLRFDATAFSGRRAGYTYNIISTWTDLTEDAQHIEINHRCAAGIEPLSMGGAYVKFVGDTGGYHVRSHYGREIYERLSRLKRAYDPTNFFSRNQNIEPAR